MCDLPCFRQGLRERDGHNARFSVRGSREEAARWTSWPNSSAPCSCLHLKTGMKGRHLLPRLSAQCFALGLLFAGFLVIVRPWYLRWGARDDELTRTLPGDEIVRMPVEEGTRAITIDAPAAAVWPWVAQLGQDRAGFYSYELLRRRGPDLPSPALGQAACRALDGHRLAVPPRPCVRAPRERARVEVALDGVKLFNYPGEHAPCILVRTGAETFVAYSHKCTHLSCAAFYAPGARRLECPCHEGYFAVARLEHDVPSPAIGQPRMNDPEKVRRHGIVSIDGALALIAVLLVVQMWLLTAALESQLAGHHETALPAAAVSAVLFLGCLGLYGFVDALDAEVRRE